MCVSALATGAEVLLKITGPSKAEVGVPVKIYVEGVTPKSSVKIIRQGFTKSDEWLELQEKDGTPVNIFWSKVTGTRHIIVFAAVNGTEKPDVAVAEYTLKYGVSPKPDPKPDPIPEPTPELKSRVGPLLAYVAANNVSETDVNKIATFYYDFSKAIRGNRTTILTTADFRNVYMEAGNKALGMAGKYAGLGALIDNIIMQTLGNQDVKFTLQLRKKCVDILQAIAWAVYEGGGQ